MDRLIVPFELDHVRCIIKNEHKRDQETWIEPPIIDQWAKAWENKLWAFTLLVNNEPIACAGIALQEWSKAEAWAIFSSEFRNYKFIIYKFIKKGLAAAFHEHKLVRIQATIDPRYPENVPWIEKLGFEYEGRLRKWGPEGQDFLMYSRLS